MFRYTVIPRGVSQTCFFVVSTHAGWVGSHCLSKKYKFARALQQNRLFGPLIRPRPPRAYWTSFERHSHPELVSLHGVRNVMSLHWTPILSLGERPGGARHGCLTHMRDTVAPRVAHDPRRMQWSGEQDTPMIQTMTRFNSIRTTFMSAWPEKNVMTRTRVFNPRNASGTE